MGILITDIYLRCDKCKYSKYTYTETIKEAEEYAKSIGWKVDGGKIYCVDCADKK